MLLLCESRRGNHDVWSHQEEGPGNYSTSKKLLSVQKSTFRYREEVKRTRSNLLILDLKEDKFRILEMQGITGHAEPS